MNDQPRKIIIPYTPRKHFIPLHESVKRFKFVVAHRRAGKSVSIINHMIRAAMQNTRQHPPPRYAYVGPSFSQTKDLIWGYLKHYTSNIRSGISEGELWVDLITGARITLYGGAAAYERMRGLYLDGAALDEYPLLEPTAFSSVVRPALGDYKGWAILSGTPKGEDHFYEMKIKAEIDENWDVFIIPVTETDALDPAEVKDMTQDMSPDEYAREMLCSFSASIVGAYYAEELNNIELEKRICSVPWQRDSLVITSWDLGVDDMTAIWFFQKAGKEIHVIDYIQGTDKGFEPYVDYIRSQKYMYGSHILPHDIKARELSSGTSRKQTLENMLLGKGDIVVCPNHKIEDGITAARSMLNRCWFDKEKTAKGIAALRAYVKGKNGKPVHNWASHAADGYRVGAVGWNLAQGWGGNIVPMGGIRRRISGLAHR